MIFPSMASDLPVGQVGEVCKAWMIVLEELGRWVTAGHTGKGSVAGLAACSLQEQLLARMGQGVGLTVPTLVCSARAARST